MLDVFIQKYFESITMRYTGETSRQSYRFVGNIKVTDHVKMGKITSRAKFQAKNECYRNNLGPRLSCPSSRQVYYTEVNKSYHKSCLLLLLLNIADFYIFCRLQADIHSEQNIGGSIWKCICLFIPFQLQTQHLQRDNLTWFPL